MFDLTGTEGAVDIYERLMADHARQRRLVQDILQLAARPAEAFALLLQLQEEVEAHQAAEEQTLYAEILALSKDSTKVSGGVSGHDAIGGLLDGLINPEPDFDAWRAGLSDLAECHSGLLYDEEALIISYARSIISEQRARALAERFDLLKEMEADVWGNAVSPALGPGWADSAAAE